MDIQKINNKGKARIFESDLLESLSKTRPWVIYAIYIPLCISMIVYSFNVLSFSPGLIISLFLLAMLGWTFFEYMAHRFLFHFNARKSWTKQIVYIVHGNHHEYPRDKERLFMPPVPSLILGTAIFIFFGGLSFLFTGRGHYALVFFPGFITGYLIYVSMHYAIHAYSPPKLLKALWRNHHLHHYKYPEKGFGVSSTLWDRIFGTMPNQKESVK